MFDTLLVLMEKKLTYGLFFGYKFSNDSEQRKHASIIHSSLNRRRFTCYSFD